MFPFCQEERYSCCRRFFSFVVILSLCAGFIFTIIGCNKNIQNTCVFYYPVDAIVSKLQINTNECPSFVFEDYGIVSENTIKCYSSYVLFNYTMMDNTYSCYKYINYNNNNLQDVINNIKKYKINSNISVYVDKKRLSCSEDTAPEKIFIAGLSSLGLFALSITIILILYVKWRINRDNVVLFDTKNDSTELV